MMKDFATDLTAYLTNVYGSSEMYNKTVYNLDGRGELKMKFTVPVGDKDEYHSIIVSKDKTIFIDKFINNIIYFS